LYIHIREEAKVLKLLLDHFKRNALDYKTAAIVTAGTMLFLTGVALVALTQPPIMQTQYEEQQISSSVFES
jgi:hypothetical protein